MTIFLKCYVFPDMGRLQYKSLGSFPWVPANPTQELMEDLMERMEEDVSFSVGGPAVLDVRTTGVHGGLESISADIVPDDIDEELNKQRIDRRRARKRLSSKATITNQSTGLVFIINRGEKEDNRRKREAAMRYWRTQYKREVQLAWEELIKRDKSVYVLGQDVYAQMRENQKEIMNIIQENMQSREILNHVMNQKRTFDEIIESIRKTAIEREEKYVTMQQIYKQVVAGNLTFVNSNKEVSNCMIFP